MRNKAIQINKWINDIRIRPGRVLVFVLLGLILSCGSESSQKPADNTPVEVAIPDIPIPDFSADSAYAFVEKQLSFGPRVPNTGGHLACADWLVKTFESYGAKVSTQPAVVQAYNGTPLNMVNIIAVYAPEKQRRVLLSAHWDSRPVADEDDERQDEPIPGANDGGSGVGILLEIARHLGQTNPNIGVDIILWDAEDYGSPSVSGSYGLGSQHWSRNKHRSGYKALYGINLDMVGAEGANFPKEGHSMQYASNIVDKVWRTASIEGFGNYFSNERTDPIIDDHVYVNAIGGVPMIDIIDQPNGRGFFEHWHTHGDDIDAISKETLKAVGQTVMAVVYREK